jgi:uncharacterized membrane-anchored protein YitT (DUF2179 family)
MDSIFSIIWGAMMWSISIKGILVHHRLLSGGISGLALVIYYLIPKLSIGLMVFLINIPIFIIKIHASRGGLSGSNLLFV